MALPVPEGFPWRSDPKYNDDNFTCSSSVATPKASNVNVVGTMSEQNTSGGTAFDFQLLSTTRDGVLKAIAEAHGDDHKVWNIFMQYSDIVKYGDPDGLLGFVQSFEEISKRTSKQQQKVRKLTFNGQPREDAPYHVTPRFRKKRWGFGPKLDNKTSKERFDFMFKTFVQGLSNIKPQHYEAISGYFREYTIIHLFPAQRSAPAAGESHGTGKPINEQVRQWAKGKKIPADVVEDCLRKYMSDYDPNEPTSVHANQQTDSVSTISPNERGYGPHVDARSA